jgi:phosphoglycerol transferase MdoB-like AlkP superfamily enzyme
VISIESKGSFDKTEKFLSTMSKFSVQNILDKHGQLGVYALSQNTPSDSGLTSESWKYQTEITKDYYSITWSNSNLTDDRIPVAILLQYGHSTGTGGYVQGTDYINPAIKPIFDKIAEDVWNEVKSA